MKKHPPMKPSANLQKIPRKNEKLSSFFFFYTGRSFEDAIDAAPEPTPRVAIFPWDLEKKCYSTQNFETNPTQLITLPQIQPVLDALKTVPYYNPEDLWNWKLKYLRAFNFIAFMIMKYIITLLIMAKTVRYLFPDFNKDWTATAEEWDGLLGVWAITLTLCKIPGSKMLFTGLMERLWHRTGLLRGAMIVWNESWDGRGASWRLGKCGSWVELHVCDGGYDETRVGEK
jgi:hypothetical protein